MNNNGTGAYFIEGGSYYDHFYMDQYPDLFRATHYAAGRSPRMLVGANHREAVALRKYSGSTILTYGSEIAERDNLSVLIHAAKVSTHTLAIGVLYSGQLYISPSEAFDSMTTNSIHCTTPYDESGKKVIHGPKKIRALSPFETGPKIFQANLKLPPNHANLKPSSIIIDDDFFLDSEYNELLGLNPNAAPEDACNAIKDAIHRLITKAYRSPSQLEEEECAMRSYKSDLLQSDPGLYIRKYGLKSYREKHRGE